MSNIIFVNAEKKSRAQAIISLLGRTPKTPSDVEAVETWTKHLKDGGIDLKDKEQVLVFIYKKMGGLIRTAEQEAKVKKAVKKARKAADPEEDGSKVDTEADEDEEEDDDE